MKFSQLASQNFETLKVLAILGVAAGHFFPESRLWVLGEIGLLIFGFSSGFFTAHIYGSSAELKTFFLNKLARLGPSLLVINAFLLLLFVLIGKQGIWSWHSLIGVFGLTGWLNWLRIPNLSPFGGGLWFFSLLLIFYLLYPLLYRLFPRSVAGHVLIFGLFLAAIGFAHWIHYGHMLWMTAFSFCFGVAYVTQRWQANATHTAVMLIAGAIGIALGGILFDMPLLSFSVVLFSWVLLIQGAMRWAIPPQISAPLRALSPCLLEIYFIHPHLFFHITQARIVDFLLSLVIIVCVSIGLHRLAEVLRHKVFVRSAPAV